MNLYRILCDLHQFKHKNTRPPAPLLVLLALGGCIPFGVLVHSQGSGSLGGQDPSRPSRPPDIFFTPTRESVADAMLVLAGVGPDDTVYDLGSGDGRIVVLAAQKYGARGVGIEIDPRLIRISRRVAQEGEIAHRVTFIEGDLFTADISPATVVTLYLSATVNRDLEPKLRRELRPGTRIVSHQFRIGSWPPESTVRADDGTDLFLWRVPAR